MKKYKRQSIVIAAVLVCIVGLYVFSTKVNDSKSRDEQVTETAGESATEEVDVDSTEVNDTEDNSYLDVGYEKNDDTDDSETDTELTGLTEEDLAENEFLVNAIIFTYTGSADEYKISKGASSADLTISKDGKETVCHIEVVGSNTNPDETKRIAMEGSEYQDADGNYFYFDIDEQTKTFVSIKFQKYITIHCEDADVFEDLELRSSTLDCC